jgi:hypothetical protein
MLCYHSVQDLLSSRLLSKTVKIRIYKTIILPVVLYGCETWSVTLREEHRLTTIYCVHLALCIKRLLSNGTAIDIMAFKETVCDRLATRDEKTYIEENILLEGNSCRIS